MLDDDFDGKISVSVPEFSYSNIGTRNSIEIAEEFFGQELDANVVATARKLPRDQQLVLLARFKEELGQSRNTFGLMRSYGQRGLEDVLALLEPVMKLLDPHNETKEIDNVFDIGPEFTPTPNLLVGEIHAHESPLFLSGPQTDVASVSRLKHLALYFEHTLIRDPLSTTLFGLPGEWWCDEDEADDPQAGKLSDEEERKWANVLADRLDQLCPIADLVRSKCFVLSWEQEVGFPYTGDPDLPLMIGRLDDPFIDWLLSQEDVAAKIGSEGLTAAALANILVEAYPRPMEADLLWDVLRFSYEARQHFLTPVTADQNIIFHLEQCARVLLDGHPEARDISELSQVVGYKLPNLSDVTYPRIAQLRMDEQVFVELRSALEELGVVCARGAESGDFESYKQTIALHADDILQPAEQRLLKWRSKLALRKAGGVALGGLVNLTLRAGAHTAGMSMTSGLSTPAQKFTQKLANRSAVQKSENVEIAYKILKSLH